MFLWLSTAAWAIPWWVPDAPTADAVREDLARFWPEGRVEIVVGPHPDGGRGVWYADGTLTLTTAERTWTQPSPDDPATWVVLARSWSQQIAAADAMVVPPPSRKPPPKLDDPDTLDGLRPGAAVRRWEAMFGYQADSDFPFGGPRGAARYRIGYGTLEVGAFVPLGSLYPSWFDGLVDVAGVDALAGLSGALGKPIEFVDPRTFTRDWTAFDIGRSRLGITGVLGAEARTWRSLRRTGAGLGVGVVFGLGYELDVAEKAGVRLLGLLRWDRGVAGLGSSASRLALGGRLDVWVPVARRAE